MDRSRRGARQLVGSEGSIDTSQSLSDADAARLRSWLSATPNDWQLPRTISGVRFPTSPRAYGAGGFPWKRRSKRWYSQTALCVVAALLLLYTLFRQPLGGLDVPHSKILPRGQFSVAETAQIDELSAIVAPPAADRVTNQGRRLIERPELAEQPTSASLGAPQRPAPALSSAEGKGKGLDRLHKEPETKKEERPAVAAWLEASLDSDPGEADTTTSIGSFFRHRLSQMQLLPRRQQHSASAESAETRKPATGLLQAAKSVPAKPKRGAKHHVLVRDRLLAEALPPTDVNATTVVGKDKRTADPVVAADEQAVEKLERSEASVGFGDVFNGDDHTEFVDFEPEDEDEDLEDAEESNAASPAQDSSGSSLILDMFLHEADAREPDKVVYIDDPYLIDEEGAPGDSAIDADGDEADDTEEGAEVGLPADLLVAKEPVELSAGEVATAPVPVPHQSAPEIAAEESSAAPSASEASASPPSDESAVAGQGTREAAAPSDDVIPPAIASFSEAMGEGGEAAAPSVAHDEGPHDRQAIDEALAVEEQLKRVRAAQGEFMKRLEDDYGAYLGEVDAENAKVARSRAQSQSSKRHRRHL